jgi:hypothetical protein
MGILVAVFIPVAVVGVLAWATHTPGLPAEAQTALDKYLSYQSSAGHAAVVEQASLAARPQSFTALMSAASFGDGLSYQVSHPYLPPATAYGPYFTGPVTTSLPVTPANTSGMRPLPFPPEELWCVRLRPAAPAGPQVVGVARHQDLFNAAWTVHELPAETQAEILAQVECRLGQ